MRRTKLSKPLRISDDALCDPRGDEILLDRFRL